MFCGLTLNRIEAPGWGSGPSGGRAFCVVSSKLSPEARQSMPNLELQIPHVFKTGPCSKLCQNWQVSGVVTIIREILQLGSKRAKFSQTTDSSDSSG